MAKKRTSRRNLEDALATWINNQADLVSNQTQFLGAVAGIEAELAEFRRTVDGELPEIKRILIHQQKTIDDQQRTFDALPEAIREKVGSKGP